MTGARSSRFTCASLFAAWQRLPAVASVCSLALACTFAGCALPAKQQAALAEARAHATASYQGRFAVRYTDGYARVQNAYGNFAWDEQADAVTLSLQNPLGSTMAVVSASSSGATLALPGKPVQSAPNVEALMQHSLGFPMPVSGLRYWLEDRVAPIGADHTVAQTTADAQGRLTQIRQDGWRIDILEFAATTASAPNEMQNELPNGALATRAAVKIRRMNLVREGTPADAPLEVKLVINP